LLMAQEAGTRGVSYRHLGQHWEASARTVRRIADQAVQLAARFEKLGSLHRPHLDANGRPVRGLEPRVVWVPRWTAEQVFLGQAAAVLMAAKPFEAASADVVADAVESLVQGALRPDQRLRLDELRKRAFYYQPALRRKLDDDVVNDCLFAVVRSHPIRIGTYKSPNYDTPDRNVVLEPWTLVQSYDGLYVLGRQREPDAAQGGGRGPEKRWGLRRPMALHRMRDVEVLVRETFVVEDGYGPEKLLGHGFGPYLGQKGKTVLFVPEQHWGFVKEIELPNQDGEPRQVEGGIEIVLKTRRTYGMERWCRWMGIEVVSEQAPLDT
jgi:hypothetical protein